MRKSWNDNAAFLEAFDFDEKGYNSAVKGIAAVARFVASEPQNFGLHSWTAMHDLCIQQTDVPPTTGPFLRLSPTHSGQVIFRYEDTGNVAKQWVRTVSPEGAVERFTKFLEQLHWVAKMRRAD